jgi:hypothetical protein
MEGFSVISIFALIGLALIVNVLFYRLKGILRKQGIDSHPFYGHFSDIIDFVHLINRTESTERKKKFIILLVSLLISLIAFIVVAYFRITEYS